MIKHQEQKGKFGAKSTADEVLDGVNLKGKRFLVTGAASGIGLETVRALVTHGADVVGADVDLTQSKDSEKELKEEASKSGGSLDLLELDLSSLKKIALVADKLLAQDSKFDVVIANAGVMATPLGRTVDGFETQLGINYIGHFALINSIASLIADNGRVIIVASQAHRISDIDLNDLNFEHQDYNPWVAYGRSKTAAALFAVELDQKLRPRGIRAASVMPGNSFTALTRYLSKDGLSSLLEEVKKARSEAGLPPPLFKEIPQAAATSLWAAVVADKNEIGGRYLEDCAVAAIEDSENPHADGVRSYAQDPVRAKLLWTQTEQLIKNAGKRST